MPSFARGFDVMQCCDVPFIVIHRVSEFLFFENPSTSFQAMSFIGSEGRPAPKLKDAVLSDAEVELVFGLSID